VGVGWKENAWIPQSAFQNWELGTHARPRFDVQVLPPHLLPSLTHTRRIRIPNSSLTESWGKKWKKTQINGKILHAHRLEILIL